MTEKMLKCHREFKVYHTHKKNTPKVQKYVRKIQKYTKNTKIHKSLYMPEKMFECHGEFKVCRLTIKMTSSTRI